MTRINLLQLKRIFPHLLLAISQNYQRGFSRNTPYIYDRIVEANLYITPIIIVLYSTANVLRQRRNPNVSISGSRSDHKKLLN